MTPERFERLKQALARRQHDLTVLADGVHKAHNVSAIIRTCDSTGIAKLHAIASEPDFRRYHGISGGVKRWVSLDIHESTEAAYSRLRGTGMQLLVAHAGPEAVDFRDVDYTRPTCIVLGAELKGPTPFALANADTAIAIPMLGLVESLNVSVAAAVILFEAQRQRIAANMYGRPPPDAAAFADTLFEWAHPKIARRCRDLGLAYPPLDESGQLVGNPFSDL